MSESLSGERYLVERVKASAPDTVEHVWVLGAEEDPAQTEVCIHCGKQRVRGREIRERSWMTGGYPKDDCVIEGDRDRWMWAAYDARRQLEAMTRARDLAKRQCAEANEREQYARAALAVRDDAPQSDLGDEVRRVCNEWVHENGFGPTSEWHTVRLLPLADRIDAALAAPAGPSDAEEGAAQAALMCFMFAQPPYREKAAAEAAKAALSAARAVSVNPQETD